MKISVTQTRNRPRLKGLMRLFLLGLFRTREQTEASALQSKSQAQTWMSFDDEFVRNISQSLIVEFCNYRRCDAILIADEPEREAGGCHRGMMIVHFFQFNNNRRLAIYFSEKDLNEYPARSEPLKMSHAGSTVESGTVSINVASFAEVWAVLCCVLTDLEIKSVILQFGEDSFSSLS